MSESERKGNRQNTWREATSNLIQSPPFLRCKNWGFGRLCGLYKSIIFPVRAESGLKPRFLEKFWRKKLQDLIICNFGNINKDKKHKVYLCDLDSRGKWFNSTILTMTELRKLAWGESWWVRIWLWRISGDSRISR